MVQNGAGTSLELELSSLAETQRLAERLARLLKRGDLVLLEGPLGAGKTEFARALLRAMTENPRLEVPSPSFSLVLSYETKRGPVHHFDLWRLSGPEELAELGFADALRDIVLVEWPDRLGPMEPKNALRISFAISGESARRARLSGWDARLQSIDVAEEAKGKR
ncbi:MAG: tRNA (adenosine(37)-N6)-threonylcarbamoyltransferase complex ATPase subunit type 1 TsaE [Acetobacteraceae bacterium]|nr:tRNA (adenosine(37)-N6)-threonylcarbamoyltransferase complex ATPase subunit type 1 TsaE [Acetobacteraceae bacterium]